MCDAGNPPRKGNTYWILWFWRLGCLFLPFVLPLTYWITHRSSQFISSLFISQTDLFEGHFRKLTPASFLSYLFEVYLCSPAAGLAGFLSVIMLIPLSFIIDFMQNTRATNVRLQAFRYRQAQVLMKVYNECFQDTVFPTLFIVHAGLIIMSLFVIVELRESLPMMGFILYPFLSIMIIGFDLVIMEFCSKPLGLSKSIKRHWQKYSYHQRDPWLHYFSRSCPVLKIYTKPKLAVDRERLAIFFRFCLQRTLFLVVFHRRITGEIV